MADVYDMLRRAELSAGTGENRFTMKRGSFSYRERIREKTTLRRLEDEPLPDGVRLRFRDPGTEAAVSLLLREEDGRWRLTAELPEGCGWNRFWLTLPADPAEHIYGCGEVYSTLDLKGESVRVWVAEHQNSARIGRKIIREKLLGKHPERTLRFGKYESYYAQPTFVSSGGYYVHADVSAYAVFDFRKPDRTTLYFQEPPVLFAGSAADFPALSEKLSALLGRQGSLPDWIYDGAILAVQEGTETVERKIAAAKEAGAKICGVWCQDWCGCRRTGFGYQVMWNWEWDRELYPGLDEKVAQISTASSALIRPISSVMKTPQGVSRGR